MATTWSQVGITVWWRCGRPVTSNSSTSTLVVTLASEPWTYHTIKGKSRQSLLSVASKFQLCIQEAILINCSHSSYTSTFTIFITSSESLTDYRNKSIPITKEKAKEKPWSRTNWKSYPNGLYILVYDKNETRQDVGSAWLYRITVWACVFMCLCCLRACVGSLSEHWNVCVRAYVNVPTSLVLYSVCRLR